MPSISRSVLYLTVLSILLNAAYGTRLAAQPSSRPGAHKKELPFRNSHLPAVVRARDLVGRMSADEKIGQLSTLFGWEMYQKDSRTGAVSLSDKFKMAIDSGHIGMLWGTLRADPWTRKTLENGLHPSDGVSVTNQMQAYAIRHSRWGIPLLLAEECAHGLMAIGTTVYPTAIGQASTWNPELIQKIASSIAAETRVMGSHVAYGPILDLARDPRWSRVEETYGEDTYLVTKMGTHFVNGLQNHHITGKTADSLHVISTLKHFVAYGVPTGGHNGGPATIGSRMLYADYLPPFEAAVKNANALSVMTAYNSIDGVPCTANTDLIKRILKKKWGFKGFVVSDLGSISGLHTASHVAENDTAAAAAAINAGVDSDLGGYGYGKYLTAAVNEGLVSTSTLDSAVQAILTLKFAMGLFEDPYRSTRGVSLVHNVRHQALNLEVARGSVVLLKRTKLPLKKDIGSIAVIGPNADNIYNQLGDYTAPQDPATVTTVLEGIRQIAGKNTTVRYARGCGIRDTSAAGFGEAINIAKKSDAVVVVLGGSSARDFKTRYKSTGAAVTTAGTVSDMENGEGNDRSTLQLLGRQTDLLTQLAATGKPVILILINGRPVAMEKEVSMAGDILEAWYPGAEGGRAIAEILFADVTPTGRLPVTIPKSVGQLPVYYSQPKDAGGHYVENDGQPLYPFGFGLSYSEFTYSDLQIKKSENGGELKIDISFKVTNTGKTTSGDVQQLYLTDETSSVTTPVRRLVGFSRCHLAPGASAVQSIRLEKSQLSLWNKQGQQVIEPGRFRVELAKYAGDPDAIKGSFEVLQTHYLSSDMATAGN